MKLLTYFSTLLTSLVILAAPARSLAQINGSISYNWQFVPSAAAFTFNSVAYVPNSIAFGNEVFIATAGREIFRSADGITWVHALSLNEVVAPSGARVTKIAYIGNRFFCLLSYPTTRETLVNPNVISSGDGIFWQAALPLTNNGAFANFNDFYPEHIAYRDNIFVMLTQLGEAAVSSDGFQWDYRGSFSLNTRDKSFQPYSLITAADSAGRESFWLAGRYITDFDIFGFFRNSYAAYARSDDGLTWTVQHYGLENATFFDIATNGAGFFYLPISDQAFFEGSATGNVTVSAASDQQGAGRDNAGEDTDAWYGVDEGTDGVIIEATNSELDFAKSTFQVDGLGGNSIYVGSYNGAPRGSKPINWTLQALAQPYDPVSGFFIEGDDSTFGNGRYIFLADDGIHVGVRVVNANAQTDLFQGANDTPAGWRRSPWFGRYFTGDPADSLLPYVYHEDIGWLKVYKGGNSVTGVYVYSAKKNLGKMYTRSSAPNWYRRLSNKTWIYHFPGTTNPQYWYNLKTKKRFLVY